MPGLRDRNRDQVDPALPTRIQSFRILVTRFGDFHRLDVGGGMWDVGGTSWSTDLARTWKVGGQAGNRQRSGALAPGKDTGRPAVHARAAVQFHVRRAIPDVSTGTAGGAIRFGRLAHREEYQQCRRNASHRKTCDPATCTCSDPSSTTMRNTRPPKSTRIDAVTAL